jgi:hypothetical protein
METPHKESHKDKKSSGLGNSKINLRLKDKKSKSVADKYYGVFKVTRWPENLDEYAVEVKKKLR